MLASTELAKNDPPVSALIKVLQAAEARDLLQPEPAACARLQTKAKWQAAAAAAGKPKTDGAEAHSTLSMRLYQNCHTTYDALTSAARRRIAGASRLVDEGPDGAVA